MATAKGQRQAAMYNTDLFNNNAQAANLDLRQNANSALGSILGGRDSAIGSLNQNADSALGSLGIGFETARGDINSGYGQARQDTQAGINLFNPWVQNGQAANTAQSDFLGLNGAAGSGAQQQALDTWRNATGYQDVVNSTTDAALRKASVVGGLGGNQIDELGRIGGQLANQTGQQYFGNLGSLSQMGLQAAGQQQQGYNNLANQGAAQGGALAGLATDYGSKQAGVYTNLGSSLGNAFQTAGAQQAGVYTGLGNSLNQLGQFTTAGITNGVTEAGQAGDAAKSANQNLALGIAGQGLKLLSAPATGGGSLFGSFLGK